MRNRMGSSLNLDTTVVGLQGHPISPTGPTSGQALVFDGTDWVPTAVATRGGAAVGAAPPASPGDGDLWFNNDLDTLNVWNGTAWVPANSADAIVQINNTLPTNPRAGELYWDLVTAKLFLWDGTQWVATINTPEGLPGPAGPAGPAGPPGPSGPTTGTGGTFVLQNQPTINQPHVMGVTAIVDMPDYGPPGQVGEYSQSTTGILSLTPGDWDVSGNVSLQDGTISGDLTSASVQLIGTSPATPNMVIVQAQFVNGWASVVIPSVRMASIANFTVSLSINPADAVPSGVSVIWARRMR